MGKLVCPVHVSQMPRGLKRVWEAGQLLLSPRLVLWSSPAPPLSDHGCLCHLPTVCSSACHTPAQNPAKGSTLSTKETRVWSPRSSNLWPLTTFSSLPFTILPSAGLNNCPAPQWPESQPLGTGQDCFHGTEDLLQQISSLPDQCSVPPLSLNLVPCSSEPSSGSNSVAAALSSFSCI